MSNLSAFVLTVSNKVDMGECSSHCLLCQGLYFFYSMAVLSVSVSVVVVVVVGI